MGRASYAGNRRPPTVAYAPPRCARCGRDDLRRDQLHSCLVPLRGQVVLCGPCLDAVFDFAPPRARHAATR